MQVTSLAFLALNNMKKTLAAILVVTLTTGCATVHDPVTGEDRYELTDTGKAVGLLVLTGVLLAGAAALGDDGGPDRTYKTSCSGNTCTTKVYE